MKGNRGNRKCEYVPAEPFSRWLNEKLAVLMFDNRGGKVDDAAKILAKKCGWEAHTDGGVRKLYRMRKMLASGCKDGRKCDMPATRFPRDTVEDALHHAGALFHDVYPDIVDEVELEPDEMCWECESVVTPIGGMCPWCEAKVGPPTGQRLAGRKLAA